MSDQRRLSRGRTPSLEQCEARVVPASVVPGSFAAGRAALLAALASRQRAVFNPSSFAMRGINLQTAGMMQRNLFSQRLSAPARLAITPAASNVSGVTPNNLNSTLASRLALRLQPSLAMRPSSAATSTTTTTTGPNVSQDVNGNVVGQPNSTVNPQQPIPNNVGDLKHGELAKAGQNLAQAYLDYQTFLQHGGSGSFATSADNTQSKLIEFVGNSVGVDVKGTGDPTAFQTALRNAGVQIQHFNSGMMIAEGLVPVASLPTVASLTQTASVSPVFRPQLSSGLGGPLLS